MHKTADPDTEEFVRCQVVLTSSACLVWSRPLQGDCCPGTRAAVLRSSSGVCAVRGVSAVKHVSAGSSGSAGT